MAKPWRRFKLKCRYIDTDGQARDFNVVMVARSVKEAINRWLYKKCANDMERRNRYSLWVPNSQMRLPWSEGGPPRTQEEANAEMNQDAKIHD